MDENKNKQTKNRTDQKNRKSLPKFGEEENALEKMLFFSIFLFFIIHVIFRTEYTLMFE